MIVLLDFDGTVVEHQYPAIGAYNEGCFEVVSALQNAGHEIVLNTYRIELEESSFQDAIDFLHSSQAISKVLKRTTKKINPQAWDLEKAIETGVLYLDDIALGIPLKNAKHSNTQMVDWLIVQEHLDSFNLFEKK
jgi:predicted mannosyl-3-phosphoglycerate phosphatase (HAD superfamily)